MRMNTFSHILIGRLLSDYVRDEFGIRLNRGRFIFGNISPDFGISMVTRPHYIKSSFGYIKKQIVSLAANPAESEQYGKKYSELLGTICHYCSDFFCHVHSINSHENLAGHIRYEKLLHRYFVHNLDAIRSAMDMPQSEALSDFCDLPVLIESYQSVYLKRGPDPKMDILFALRVCVMIIVSLDRCLSPSAVPEPLVFPAFEAAVGSVLR